MSDIESKFNEVLKGIHHRAMIMIRNWYVLEELCASGASDEHVILEGQKFDHINGICGNLSPSRLSPEYFYTMTSYDFYNITDVYNEYTRNLNRQWAKKEYGYVPFDIGYFIDGRQEYTQVYADRRLYTNHKRLHYLIYLANELHKKLTEKKDIITIEFTN